MDLRSKYKTSNHGFHFVKPIIFNHYIKYFGCIRSSRLLYLIQVQQCSRMHQHLDVKESFQCLLRQSLFKRRKIFFSVG